MDAWRDTHVRIEGPAVLAVQMARTLDARQALRHGDKPAAPSMASLIGHVPDGPRR